MKRYAVHGTCIFGFIIVILLLIMTNLVFASDIVDSGKCGSNATWTLTKDGIFTVSGTGVMEDYDYIGDNEQIVITTSGDYVQPWRNHLESIKKVVINEGITHISACGFVRCENLNEITLPESLCTIGSYSFAHCKSLNEVVLPEKLEEVDNSAFEDTSIVSVKIPTVTRISVDSFSGPLFSEYDVDSDTVISYYDDDGCLHTIYPSYRSVDGILYNNDMSRLLDYPSGKGGDYTLPNSVEYITAGALSVYEPINRLVIPDAGVEINVDNGPVNAREVVLPDGMKEIPGYIFDHTSIERIHIPDSVERIGSNAFNGCSNLKSIKLPDEITEIGDCAFIECDSLEHLNLPASLTYLGDLAFYGCKKWKDPVIVPGSLKSINMWAFMGCRSIPSVTLESGVQKIGSEVFYNCNNLATVSLPDSVTEIGDESFYHCNSLVSMKIPSGVSVINEGMFSGCTNLRALLIPESVLSIEMDSVKGCSLLKNIYYEGSADRWKRVQIDNTSHGNDPLIYSQLYTNSNLSYIEKDYSPVGMFIDVIEKDYFSVPVLWAVNHDPQITKGTSDTTFSPSDTCTRGQAVTFLWRACGCEMVTDVENPFTDVKSTDYYYDAVLWAYKNKVTTGTTATTFGPNETCNRGQIVTFLWRSQGEPASTASIAFIDVADNAYYYAPVRWAVEKEITKGTTDKTFSPNDSCTRGQIVTFLFRAVS